MDEEPHEEPDLPEETPKPVEEVPPEEPLFSPEEVPMKVSVQVGQVVMNAEKLLSLQAGNTLELTSERIELLAGGKRIARGELLRIGEALGVRILELG